MPQAGIERLLEGNRRFASHLSTHVYGLEAEQQDLVGGQHPFATVFGCADSRVPVELIFDQGLGDLFVIRNAGHIVGESVLGSMEFAATVIGCRLIVVIGHSHCGAVTAAVKAWETGYYPEGHIASIVRAIEPVVRDVDTHDIDAVMRAHVIDTTRTIYNASETLAKLVRSGDLAIVAAEYQLSTLAVNVLGVLDRSNAPA